MPEFQVVDVETARVARGLRLVVLADVPSPWSQAAKMILEMKQIPALIVRKAARDQSVQAWTGIANAPIAIYENEPPLSGWADILELAERLRPEVPLVPRDPEQRVLMHGLSHELLGAGGLVWSARLFTIDASLSTGGARGFPLSLAKHLAARYGHVPGCGDAARARATEILATLSGWLRKSRRAGYDYYLGSEPTALDVYSAAAFNTIAMLPPDQCPTHPAVRPAFEWMGAELGQALAPELLAHRDHMMAKHFQLPLQL